MKPDEPVASVAWVSSIMPRGAAERPHTYEIALIIGLAAALLAAILGLLPIAVILAAFAIPVVYIVYMYDVNLWKDEPVPVAAMAFVLTGVLSLGFTLLWTNLRGEWLVAGRLAEGRVLPIDVTDLLLLVFVVPIVGEVIKQIGPLFLASRPHFDDLMDGLTFGIISGVAYASFDTLVKHWDLLTGGGVGTDNPGMWASLIFLEGFIKPLIFGTATGIACAEFSGLGEGYDGFSPRYFRGLGEAILANVLYQLGLYLVSWFVPDATVAIVLSVVIGLVILGVLILRVRNILHIGLMEAALESAARESALGTVGRLDHCPQCEMPLVAGADFCSDCGRDLRRRHSGHQQAAVPVASGEDSPSERVRDDSAREDVRGAEGASGGSSEEEREQ